MSEEELLAVNIGQMIRIDHTRLGLDLIARMLVLAPAERIDAQTALDEVVRAFEVQDLMTARLYRLSSGQRQRAHLARIWLQGALITLLDEPDSSLDETGRSMLRGAVQACVRAGRTVVLVTHDRGWAMSEADLVWEVCAGRIVVG